MVSRVAVWQECHQAISVKTRTRKLWHEAGMTVADVVPVIQAGQSGHRRHGQEGRNEVRVRDPGLSIDAVLRQQMDPTGTEIAKFKRPVLHKLALDAASVG